MASEPLFSPAVVVVPVNGDGYHVEIFQKAGQVGRSDAHLIETLEPGEVLEYRAYAGKTKLLVTVTLIDPE